MSDTPSQSNEPTSTSASTTTATASTTSTTQTTEGQKMAPSKSVVVKLDLENWVLPPERLRPSPSQSHKEGMDMDTELDLRILGCDLIQNAGIMLKLPQVAMASAQMLFQRLYYSPNYSFQNHKMDISAMAALFVASKIEECPRRARDIINVFTYLLSRHKKSEYRSSSTNHVAVSNAEYERIKTRVINAESRLLINLGFCVRSNYPHKILVNYLRAMINRLDKEHTIWTEEDNDRLLQYAWNYMNDSLRTSVFVQYSSEVITCACLHLATLILKRSFPDSSDNKPWYGLFDVSKDDVMTVCNTILRLYIRPAPKIERLIQYLSIGEDKHTRGQWA